MRRWLGRICSLHPPVPTTLSACRTAAACPSAACRCPPSCPAPLAPGPAHPRPPAPAETDFYLVNHTIVRSCSDKLTPLQRSQCLGYARQQTPACTPSRSPISTAQVTACGRASQPRSRAAGPGALNTPPLQIGAPAPCGHWPARCTRHVPISCAAQAAAGRADHTAGPAQPRFWRCAARACVAPELRPGNTNSPCLLCTPRHACRQDQLHVGGPQREAGTHARAALCSG